VKEIAFRLRDEGSFTIDTLWTEPTSTPRTEFAPTELIARLAFPKPLVVAAEEKVLDAATHASTASVRSLETRDVQLLTNAKSLELERLAAHLSTVAKQVRKEMPFLAETQQGPLLVIFQEPTEYHSFIARHTRRLNVLINLPETPGFTVQGVSSSVWNKEHGSLRSVFTHEFLHGYFCHTTRIPCRGEWLQEGLATYFQLKFHPQDNLSQIVREGLKSSQKQTVLRVLCNGHHIKLTEYWQAGTLWQMLLNEPRYQSHMATLFQRIEATASTDLAPHLEPVWQTDWDKLTTDWRTFCEREFAEK
jgi:hypothetical protein